MVSTLGPGRGTLLGVGEHNQDFFQSGKIDSRLRFHRLINAKVSLIDRDYASHR
jgi:hypothetical protein